MYHKGIIMEIKKDHCLVLDEDGTVVRLQLKKEVSVGQKIYYFDEDVYEEETQAEKKFIVVNPMLKKAMITALALFLIVSAGVYTTLLHPDAAYATVSFDADKSLQVIVDDQYRIKEAISYDKTLSKEELDALLGKNIKDMKPEIQNLYKKGQTLIIGYAMFDQKDDQGEIEALLHSLFGKDHVIYVNGQKADIMNAEKQKTNVGEYILSDADYDEIEDVIEHLQADELQDFIKHNEELIQDEEVKEEIDDRIEDLYESDDDDDEEEDEEEDDEEDKEDDD